MSNRKVTAPKRKRSNPVARLHRQTEAKMREERTFWDDVVRIMTYEEMDKREVHNILDIADQLTAARRERYPLEEK